MTETPITGHSLLAASIAREIISGGNDTGEQMMLLESVAIIVLAYQGGSKELTRLITNCIRNRLKTFRENKS